MSEMLAQRVVLNQGELLPKLEVFERNFLAIRFCDLFLFVPVFLPLLLGEGWGEGLSETYEIPHIAAAPIPHITTHATPAGFEGILRSAPHSSPLQRHL